MHQVTEQIREISVYGCGGTGSHIINGLASLHTALKQLGKPEIHVTAYDHDTVSHENVGRQAFFPCDVGSNKAKVLTKRINAYYQTRWLGIPSKAPSSDKKDLVISCVDTVASRERIAKSWQKEGTYMIDCGNSRSSGQVLIGQYKGKLPNIYEDNSDLIYGDEAPDDEPGCVDQYYRQDLFTNRVVADQALHLVWRLLKWGSLEVQGVFFDINKGVCNPVKIQK